MFKESFKIKGRVISPKDAEKLAKVLTIKKVDLADKTDKIIGRLELIDAFIDESKNSDLKFKDWLSSKGFDIYNYFAPLGYYTTQTKVVSADDENQSLDYDKGMVFSAKSGYPIPTRKMVSQNDHEVITNSKIGFKWDPKNKMYVPKVVFNENAFKYGELAADLSMDTMGGFAVSDIGNFKNDNQYSRDLTLFFKELLEEELDDVGQEYESILDIETEMYGDFSEAEGRPVANVTCRSTCGVKHPFNKSRRENCQKICDSKYPPTEKQEDRREDRQARQDARREKREAKKDCKEQFKSGKITRKEFRDCKKSARKEKQQKIHEAGGNIFTKTLRFSNRIDPINMAARGSFLGLVKKYNIFGIATRLAPAIATPEVARSKFTPEAIDKAKKAWKKVKKMWWQVGGQEDKLVDAIEEGYKKRPYKGAEHMNPESSFNGELYSNAADSGVYAMIAAAITLITSVTSALLSTKAPKNPYKEGQTPADYDLSAVNEGDNLVANENTPMFDPDTEKWIDPKSGREVDPTTGEFKDNILGMNKWLFIGLSAAAVTTIVIGLSMGKGKVK